MPDDIPSRKGRGAWPYQAGSPPFELGPTCGRTGHCKVRLMISKVALNEDTNDMSFLFAHTSPSNGRGYSVVAACHDAPDWRHAGWSRYTYGNAMR